MNAELIKEIIRKEWMQFQKVRNQGGRAPCQNDYQTFVIMRMSQFSTWSDDICRSYLDDLDEAEKQGRNLLSEKYAYMMQRTDPAGFEKIKHLIPPISQNKQRVIDVVADVQLRWQNEYVKRYPCVAAGSRPTAASADNLQCTSFETYLRGELATYSERTLSFYLERVRKFESEGRNMTLEALECTAKLYGFSSLNELEAQTGKFSGRKYPVCGPEE